ncbi:anthranilate synthase component I family protein [Peribacillus alkalitolerans]|uniref:anthranilate synthase component I family protein n=1 Tax=Peribacillus alkalitolerans TaxID=1550385 RepID=UPI0013D6860F|nr:anthranilate synthase component I family protein [Peribacillus alkalitolerans]
MKKRKVFSRAISMNERDFFDIYLALSVQKSHHILLESGRGGKYSFAGISPVAVLEGKDNELIITEKDHSIRQEGEPLLLMKEWMASRNVIQDESLPDFQGGAMGFISYDYARYIEKLPSLTTDDLLTPDIYFMVFDELLAYEHENKTLWLLYTGVEDQVDIAEEILNRMESDVREEWTSRADLEFMSEEIVVDNDELTVSMTENEFMDAVERVRDYISKGDIFQVNLSVRQSKPLLASPIEIYEELRKLNPSPYMSYVETLDFQIVSGSPELLIKKKGLDVSTRPIAGTRSRGANAEEDESLAKELIDNEKERAEHVMLVDLERNDLGRVCRFGTVEVDEFMVIEKYSHVMHIVSNVRGELADGQNEYDVIKAVFPGGTITGAPKIRTMEIIEELEPVRRGIYTGSIGWIGYSGEMELNIVIRTMLAKDGMGHVQAGAGVVIDSNPKYEYLESLKKAAALWRAKEQADSKYRKAGHSDDTHD